MSQLLNLGAINKLTGDYEAAKTANKKDEYKCPDCGDDVIVCQGEIRNAYYRHSCDRDKPCNYYSNPNESQIHKDAKMILKNLFEKKKNQISISRICCCCKKKEEFEIPEITETSVIEIEYRFEFNGVKIADVAYIDCEELLCIFEIYYKHKTSNENRPEPWFELNAEALIKIVNDNEINSLQLPCVRCKKCENCIEKEEQIKLQRKEQIKNEKIERINKAIENCKKSFVEIDMDWMYEDNKSQKNQLKALNTHLAFVENNIEYNECGINIYEIIHPLSKQIVKLSSKNKAFVNGKWININFTDIIKWYNNDKNNTIDNENKKKEQINNGNSLKYALTAKNKTERKNMLSKYLQSNKIGQLNELDEYYFTQIYNKFYLYEDEKSKFKIDDIQKVIIENVDYGSRCFNLLVANIKYPISIKRFN
jgi:uncharacterized protein YkuJ